jgi:hypothetical protein
MGTSVGVVEKEEQLDETVWSRASIPGLAGRFI